MYRTNTLISLSILLSRCSVQPPTTLPPPPPLPFGPSFSLGGAPLSWGPRGGGGAPGVPRPGGGGVSPEGGPVKRGQPRGEGGPGIQLFVVVVVEHRRHGWPSGLNTESQTSEIKLLKMA